MDFIVFVLVREAPPLDAAEVLARNRRGPLVVGPPGDESQSAHVVQVDAVIGVARADFRPGAVQVSDHVQVGVFLLRRSDLDAPSPEEASREHGLPGHAGPRLEIRIAGKDDERRSVVVVVFEGGILIRRGGAAAPRPDPRRVGVAVSVVVDGGGARVVARGAHGPSL